MDRRTFLRHAACGVAGAALAPLTLVGQGPASRPEPWFRISLAQWSLHRRLFGRAEPKLDPLGFAAAARGFGIDAIEYVNQFYRERVRERGLGAALRQRAKDHGVQSLLIMCDGDGALGDPDAAARARAVENHRKWLELAAELGCHAIRVNAASQGARDEQERLAADGLRRLCEVADGFRLSVLVENHGGLSSDGAWLAAVMKRVAHARIGTLPDFGNFTVAKGQDYDRYRGVEELLPFARAVSAKSYEFDAKGDETTIDYLRMLRLVRAAGYRGHVGIEYEGGRLDEAAGILATKQLLERVRERLA